MSKLEEGRMNSNGNENEARVGSSCGSERKGPRWKYTQLPNEKDLIQLFAYFLIR